MNFIKRLLPHLKDKYVLATLIFLVWLTFFDRNDFFAQHTYSSKLKELETEKQYYIDEIQKNKTALASLMGNKKNLEKFAREKYLMKKDNEDIFLVVREK
ncbi:MAG TPA: septum formation initiator family protein [Bacteroidia bacterium]|nr:septum formation initiator family protein [Bacteroidia bacterium]